MLTIIKHSEAERRGRLHGYHITVVGRDGTRSTWAVLAMNGRKAIDQVRQATDPTRIAPEVAA